MSARLPYSIALSVASTRLARLPCSASLLCPQLPTTHSFFLEQNS